MKKFLRRLPGCLLLLAILSPTVKAADALYENPVIAGDHPDPSIIRVGKDFWASCTSSEWGPEFPLLHSTDLVNWDRVGAVFPQRPAWAVGNFWAPEIWEHEGRYYVYYVGREKDGPLAVAVATADHAEGPYTDHGPLVAQPQGSIDPAPCLDENGKRYLIWKDDNNSIRKPTTIWAQPLNEDGTKLIGEPTGLIRNNTDWEGGLVEGPYILRRGDWFYLFYSANGCCGTGCNYAVGVARSHKLLGPWEKNPANPILAGNERWKCPGHGSVISDEQGRYWFLYHAYAAHGTVFTGREAMLDQVVFGTNDWPTINHGTGPSAQSFSPFGAAQARTDLAFSDDFTGRKISPTWQWPQNHPPRCRLAHGHIELSGTIESSSNNIVAVLAHSTLTANYTATTVVDVAHLKEGASAGLSAFGDTHNAIGLSVSGGKLTLWRRERGNYQSLAEAPAPAGKTLTLRLMVKDGFQFHFAASANDKEWTPVGESLSGKNLPPWDRSVRVALTVEGNGTAEARFNSFHLTPVAELTKEP